MRRIGFVLLIAVAVSACRSPPLVDRPDALGPSIVVRHAVESDIEVAQEQAEDLDPGGQVDHAVPGGGPPVGRTTRRPRDRSEPAPDEDGLDAAAVRANRAPGWTGGEGHRPPTDPDEPTTAPGDAQDSDLATLPGSSSPASTARVEGERARSGTSTSPWPWVALAVVLVVAGVLLVRRLRARSRVRSHQYDPNDAWDVFQAGLASAPRDGGSAG